MRFFDRTEKAPLCGLMFFGFSLTYMFVFQRDIMEALHYSLAHGKTVYAPFVSSLVITVLLLLLARLMRGMLKLRGPFRAMAYVPSCLVLMALTDVGRSVYENQYHSVWLWLLPVLVLVFIGLCLVLRRCSGDMQSRGNGALKDAIANILTMLGLSIVTVLTGTTDKSMHNELEMEHYMKVGQNEEALKVAEKSLRPTRTLTALRGLAMSRCGSMGDRLFEFPQYFRADGLFFDNDSMKTLRYTNDSIYDYLGDRPGYGESPQDFLKRICDNETGSYKAAEYYMSALLLNKRLDAFCETVEEFYSEEDSLPRYYREALVLKEKLNINSDSVYVDEVMNRFSEYQKHKTELEKQWPANSTAVKNYMRRKFGDTYWWYFDYQE